jgi:hypothetical protein
MGIPDARDGRFNGLEVQARARHCTYQQDQNCADPRHGMGAPDVPMEAAKTEMLGSCFII